MTKKDFFKSFFVLVGAGLVGFASCTNEDENSVTPDEKGLIPVEIRGSIGGDSRTKLSDSDSKTVEFQSGDSLAVWDGQGDQKIRRFGTKDGGSVAIFKGSLDENASNLNILYPLQDGATCTGTNITATIPTEQTAVEGNFDPKANLSVTTATYTKGQNVTCTLENVCGLLKFTISEFTLDYDSIRIRAISGTEAQDIAGKAEISASERKITGITSGGGSKTITLKKKDDANKLSAGKTYYIVMKPQTSIDSLEMTFFQNDMIVGLPMNIAKASKESFTVTPGVILNLGTVRPAPAFSVSATKKVIFAPGNLQATYHTATGQYTWGFAENQWSYIGNAAGNTTINGDGTNNDNAVVDLFGWTATNAGYNDGKKQYGINTSTASADYGNGDECCNWGSLITDGYTWRTLTGAGGGEWDYLLNSRKNFGDTDGNKTARYAKAIVNSVNGLLIIPDGYTKKDGNTNVEGVTIQNVNTPGAPFVDITDKWTTLENAGCVFLPCAGMRTGISVSDYGAIGKYYSSTSNAATHQHGWHIRFSGGEVAATACYDQRFNGMAIRLVREVAATVPATLTGGISSGGISSGSFSTE